MDMQELRARARERMKGYCRVCPVCDGRACAGETPGMGGIGSGASFRNNIQALADVQWNMRLIHEVKRPDTETSILGMTLRLPVLAAPVAGTAFNMGGFLDEATYAAAVVSGCRKAGIVGCMGDGAPDELHEAGNAAIAAEGGWGIPFIKPWDGEELEAKIVKAASTGARVLGMDLDAAGLIALARMGRPVSPKSRQELSRIVERVHREGMKFLLKGLMTPEDALAAEGAGCDGIVVSNHGGRVLDGTRRGPLMCSTGHCCAGPGRSGRADGRRHPQWRRRAEGAGAGRGRRACGTSLRHRRYRRRRGRGRGANGMFPQRTGASHAPDRLRLGAGSLAAT